MLGTAERQVRSRVCLRWCRPNIAPAGGPAIAHCTRPVIGRQSVVDSCRITVRPGAGFWASGRVRRREKRSHQSAQETRARVSRSRKTERQWQAFQKKWTGCADGVRKLPDLSQGGALVGCIATSAVAQRTKNSVPAAWQTVPQRSSFKNNTNSLYKSNLS